jgi:integrase/recombinase XerD
MSGPSATELIGGWLASQRSDHTRAAYRNDMASYAAWCGGERVVLSTDAAMLSTYRAERIADGSSMASVARRMSALNGFFRFAYEQGAIERHPVAPVDQAPVEESSTPSLSVEQRRSVLDAAAASSSTTNVLVSMLLRDGLKLGEVLALDTAHVVRPGIAVRLARDGSVRRVELRPGTVAALRAHLRGRPAGPLMPGLRSPRLTRFAADDLIKRVGAHAGVQVPLTSNTLRRSFVTHAHAKGVSIDEIRHRAGHDDARTTRRYLPITP